MRAKQLFPACQLLSSFPALLDLFQHSHKHLEVSFSVFIVIRLSVAENVAINRNRYPDDVFRGPHHYFTHRLDGLIDVAVAGFDNKLVVYDSADPNPRFESPDRRRSA